MVEQARKKRKKRRPSKGLRLRPAPLFKKARHCTAVGAVGVYHFIVDKPNKPPGLGKNQY